MTLPDGDRAQVDDGKLVDYCLSPTHPRGRHKARLFAAALGFTQATAADLKTALLHAARTADAVATRHNGFGQLDEITFDCTGPIRTATLLSVWVVLDANPVPQLVTCYPV
jgi:hypothetical protein